MSIGKESLRGLAKRDPEGHAMLMAAPMKGGNSRIVGLYQAWETEELARVFQQERLKDLFALAKEEGFNTKALRNAFRLKLALETESDEQRQKRLQADDDTSMYLGALARVRARENIDEFSDSDGSETGNMALLDDDIVSGYAITEPAAPVPTGDAADTPGSAEDAPPLSGATESTAARKDVRAGSEGETAGREMAAQPDPVHAPQAGTQAPPVDTQQTEAQRIMDEVVAKGLNPETHFLNSKGLKRLHGCLKPEACGGSHRARCFTCQKKWADEQGFAA